MKKLFRKIKNFLLRRKEPNPLVYNSKEYTPGDTITIRAPRADELPHFDVAPNLGIIKDLAANAPSTSPRFLANTDSEEIKRLSRKREGTHLIDYLKKSPGSVIENRVPITPQQQFELEWQI